MSEQAKEAAAKNDAKKSLSEEEKHIIMTAVKQSDRSGYNDNWYLDSSCSSHVTPQRELFVSLERLEMLQEITTFKGTIMEAIAKSTVVLKVAIRKDIVELELHNVGWTPGGRHGFESS